MTDPLLIQKFNLQETALTMGDSFVFNLKIYIWPALSTDGRMVYVMECDGNGHPLPEGKVKICSRKGSLTLHVDAAIHFLLDYDGANVYIKKELERKELQDQMLKSPELKN